MKELDLSLNGKSENLARYGLRQFVTGELEFRLSPRFLKDRAYREESAFRHLLSVMRWLRYQSEHPWMKLSDASEKVLADLLGFLRPRYRSGRRR